MLLLRVMGILLLKIAFHLLVTIFLDFAIEHRYMGSLTWFVLEVFLDLVLIVT